MTSPTSHSCCQRACHSFTQWAKSGWSNICKISPIKSSKIVEMVTNLFYSRKPNLPSPVPKEHFMPKNNLGIAMEEIYDSTAEKIQKLLNIKNLLAMFRNVAQTHGCVLTRNGKAQIEQFHKDLHQLPPLDYKNRIWLAFVKGIFRGKIQLFSKELKPVFSPHNLNRKG